MASNSGGMMSIHVTGGMASKPWNVLDDSVLESLFSDIKNSITGSFDVKSVTDNPELEKRLKEALEKLSRAEKENDNLKKSLSDAESKLVGLESEKFKLEEEKQKLEKEKQELEREKQELEAKLEKANTDLKDSQEYIDDLHKELDKWSKIAEDKQKAIDNLTAELTKLKNELEEAYDKILELQNAKKLALEKAYKLYDSKDITLSLYGIDVNKYYEHLSLNGRLLLHGVPGTGKTVLAKILCKELWWRTSRPVYYMLESFIDKQKEDIVGGMTLNADGGVEWSDGSLTNLCRVAINNPDNIYVYIMDEVNRSDAMMALGALSQGMEQVGTEVNIGKGQTVAVPSNLCFIATMNDYDKGAGKLDLALRSRFTCTRLSSFIYDDNLEELFDHYRDSGLSFDAACENKFTSIVNKLKELRSEEYALYSGELIEIGARELIQPFSSVEGLFSCIENDICEKIRQLAKQSKEPLKANAIIDEVVKLAQ